LPEGNTARDIDMRPDNNPVPHARQFSVHRHSRADSRRLSFQNTPPQSGVVIMRVVVTRLALLAVLVPAGITLLHTGAQAAPDDCAPDTARALQQARESLESDDPAKDRAALTCLVEAVAALNFKLSQLMTGEIPFEGQAWLEKGWVINKPAPEAE
jgi:hypothetical protein